MATYSATVCDFNRCRALADAQCIVCGLDGCEKHLDNTLGLVLVGLPPDNGSLPTDQRPVLKLAENIHSSVRQESRKMREAQASGRPPPARSLEIHANPFVIGECTYLCWDCLRTLTRRISSTEVEQEVQARIYSVITASWKEVVQILQVGEAARRLKGKG